MQLVSCTLRVMQILNLVITGNSESSSYHPSSSYSIFPMENNEIMTSNWEEQVIWEDDDLRKLCGLWPKLDEREGVFIQIRRF